MKITNTMNLASFIVRTLGSVLPNAPREIARRGKSATRRAAIVPEFKSVDGLPGSDVINQASLSVAIFPVLRSIWPPRAKGPGPIAPVLTEQ